VRRERHGGAGLGCKRAEGGALLGSGQVELNGDCQRIEGEARSRRTRLGRDRGGHRVTGGDGCPPAYDRRRRDSRSVRHVNVIRSRRRERPTASISKTRCRCTLTVHSKSHSVSCKNSCSHCHAQMWLAERVKCSASTSADHRGPRISVPCCRDISHRPHCKRGLQWESSADASRVCNGIPRVECWYLESY